MIFHIIDSFHAYLRQFVLFFFRKNLNKPDGLPGLIPKFEPNTLTRFRIKKVYLTYLTISSRFQKTAIDESLFILKAVHQRNRADIFLITTIFRIQICKEGKKKNE